MNSSNLSPGWLKPHFTLFSSLILYGLQAPIIFILLDKFSLSNERFEKISVKIAKESQVFNSSKNTHISLFVFLAFIFISLIFFIK